MVCIEKIDNVDKIENKVIIRPVGTVELVTKEGCISIDPKFYYKLDNYISFGESVGEVYVMRKDGLNIYRVHSDEFKSKFDIKIWFYNQVNNKCFKDII